ncbi:hypothetical protein [Corynebacterium comes]|uniref:Uncharacterized protein n=1 Tax=Corynebacterium comes TaxID=2675218 RepID=A0A6B8VXG9_9CORY|nr:hypothetical protein [Corynebacterium comes]QGU03685.1 hypothetical protein CETAM_02005 [Corynebacterium comes]
MGRLLLVLLIIVAIVLLWKAFGPSSWKRNQIKAPHTQAIKGPDDDEEFLWTLEKNRFKERRARETAEREEEERRKRAEERHRKPDEEPGQELDQESEDTDK